MRAALLVGALALAGASAGPGRAAATTTPIKHLVVVMQENHTYDNYFGTYPRGDGVPAGTCVPVDPRKPEGPCVKPFRIGENDVRSSDLDHSAVTFTRQYRGGRMDGFVHALDLRNQDGRMAMGYRDRRDIPFYWNLADEYVLFDRFFASAAAGSYINHLYWVSGSPGTGEDRLPTGGYGDIPTIFDRLQERGIPWKLYVQNYDPNLTYRTMTEYPGNRASQVIWAPLLAFDRFLDTPELFSRIVNLEEYHSDLAAGTLPAVSYIVPSGPSEHPPSNIASGEAFVRTLLNGLIASEHWEESAFLLTYDDWGGWYDHVRPPQVDEHGYGFRVPALLVSPYARRGYTDSTVLDFTSILKFVEENWRIPPLAERDAAANSFMDAFDFTSPPRPAAFTSPRELDSAEPNVRRSVIYVLYGGAVLLAASLIVVAAVRERLLVDEEVLP